MVSISSATMQAAWYERIGPAREVLEVGQLPIPEPVHGELLVRVAASGVNPHDVKKRAGWLGSNLPCHRVIPHSDCAGVVTALGSEVKTCRAGDRVFIYGAGYARPGEGAAAEFVAVPADNALPLPSAVTLYLRLPPIMRCSLMVP